MRIPDHMTSTAKANLSQLTLIFGNIMLPINPPIAAGIAKIEKPPTLSIPRDA